MAHRRLPGIVVLTPVIMVAAIALGCSNELETGYKPQSLGASSAVRRSYYASPFTAESNAAAQERETELQSRRPKPGY